ncbi:peptidoglycan-binding protein [Roseovarius amoyensis]|uniref:peptidoglycan-binding protein n=1 Tax=Roseovarius amoyensis TaxID=2211448 RepID=UPI0019550FD9
MTPRPPLAALMAALALGGCQAALPQMAEPVHVSTRDEAPPGAAPGTCWGQDETPAVVETVTEQIILQPPEILADGTVQRPAVYKTETRQQIVKPRKTTWFETPCEHELTPEFIASLQRALAARGRYRGAVTGRMDARTRTAIRGFQRPQGLDSGMISLAAARQMGLIALDRPDSGADIDAAPAAQVAVLSGPAKAAEQPSEDQPDTRRAAEAEAEAEAIARAEAARAEAEASARAQAKAEADARAQAEAAEKAARKAELRAALEAERAARAAKAKPLPVSSETY